MSLKEKLLGLRKKLVKVSEVQPKESIDLNNKVEEFISDYRTSLSGMDESDITISTNKMRNFIEKMAVWYELKFPKDQEVDGDHLDEIYGKKTLIKLLSEEEKDYLRQPHYPTSVNMFNDGFSVYRVALSPNGYIQSVDFANVFVREKLDGKGLIEAFVRNGKKSIKLSVRVEEIIGLKIEDAISLLESRGFKFTTGDSVICDILKHDQKVKQRKEMLDAIMYRIIERGGEFYGPFRAFMYAKDFNMDIEIPMKYGIESFDFPTRELIQAYVMAGGNPDIECYIGYFRHAADRTNLKTKSIREILAKSDYLTQEEFDLYQSLTNTFANLRDQRIESNPEAYLNELKAYAQEFQKEYREKVAKKRIARGLEKSMARMKRL